MYCIFKTYITADSSQYFTIYLIFIYLFFYQNSLTLNIAKDSALQEQPVKNKASFQLYLPGISI